MVNIELLQTLTVRVGDDPPIELGSPKTRSLFAYLVLHHGEAIDRRRLAFLLWERSSETAARRNLRQYLHRLRKSLAAVDPDESWIVTTGNHVRFVPPAAWWLDVAAFEAAATPPEEDLSQAVALYRGELLQDIYEDWVIPERERLERRYRECLLRLTDQLAEQRRWEDAIRYGKQLVAIDPLVETSHVRLLRLYHQAQDRARLVQHYAQLEKLLVDELGLAPSAETQQTYQSLLTDEPIVLQSPARLPTATDVTPPPFIGRKAALQLLNQRYATTQNAHGGIILIRGEMGIGKTRLVNEWLDQLAGEVILFQARAHEFEGMIPYAPLREALTSTPLDTTQWELFLPAPPWLSALAPLLPTLAEKVALQTESQPSNPIHLIQAVGSFLFALARMRSVVLVIDNLHWADVETWNVLAYLAQRVGTQRLLVVGTVRDEDISADATRLIRKLENRQLVDMVSLARLSADETTQLVTRLMPNLDPRFVRRLYQETQGNPFFIIETVKAVQEAGGDWTEQVPTDERGNRPIFAIPLKVQSIIESRLDQLSDDSRMALSVAAAIGRAFTFDVLQQVSQIDTATLLDALDEWLTRGIVRERRDGYDFTHEQLGHVAYNQLSRARRQWIHLQIGDYLTAQPDSDPAQLAHHLYLSSDPARALPYLIHAGERALRVRSYDVAREYGQRAIGLFGRFPATKELAKRLDLNLQLAQAHAFSGAISKAIDLLQETEHLAQVEGDMHRLTRIFHRSSQLFWLRGLPDRANTYARRTLRHAEELNDAEMRFAALRMLGRTSIAQSEFDDAIAYLIRYSDLNDPDAPNPDLSVIFGYLGVAYARVGSWQRAIDAAQRGVDLASVHDQGATHVVACMQQAFIHAELREWETALAVLAPVRDVWREAGMSPHAYMMRVVLGRCLVELETEGLAEIRAALDWAEAVDYRVFTHTSHLMYAQALHAAQDPTAYAVAQQAYERAVTVGDRWAQGVALRTQATIDMRDPHKADWPRAERQLLDATQLLRQTRARPDLAHTYLMLRRLYDRAGQSAWAIDCHFRAITIFEELGMERELAEARGQAAGERTGAVVLPGLQLNGPILTN